MKTLLLLFTMGYFFILNAEETAYVNKISVKQGDTLEFHVSTQTNPFFIRIYKMTGEDTWTDQLVTTISHNN